MSSPSPSLVPPFSDGFAYVTTLQLPFEYSSSLNFVFPRRSHIELNDTQKRILNFLSDDPNLSAVRLAEQLGISSRNVEKNIKKLKEYGILIRHGSPKNGYWEIVVEN